MPTTITVLGPAQQFGPSSTIDALPNIASPQNLPWHWLFLWYLSGGETPIWTESRPDATGGGVRNITMWNNDGTPITLNASQSFQEGAQVRLVVRVTDDNGFQVNPEESKTLPWSNTTFAHVDNLRLHQWTQTQLSGGGGGDDRLDQILAAVYRTWPSA